MMILESGLLFFGLPCIHSACMMLKAVAVAVAASQPS